MSQHAELIARLCNTPNWQRESYGDWKSGTLFYDRAPFEAADALQAMERKPMTEQEALKLAHRRATAYTHRSDPLYHSYAFVPHTLMAFVRDLEAFHGIQPPNVKGE